ncbi:serine/threonine-protein kinase [Kitasatospora sp. NPDC089913]|uniref:serine/threonine-protein kinase n=1 Tax=Streptomycetaceae TaxID=2062 RepID=UPI00087CF459|nr:serine/threonine-protein kinase [Streptomyces sp. TLI_053]SDT42990.1 Serine/threonine protein kinase [Streptomyces sp. TLI_053]
MQHIGRGTVLGNRYGLEQPLARGSMGHVWQGRDRHLGRAVAVKLVPADLLSDPAGRDGVLRRFELEAKAAAALDHVNIATVHDADITGETCWLVMQLVVGSTLGVLLDERERLDVESAVAVAAQLCAGLSAAHAAGLVHRDLKAENVMVAQDGVVKILDFGLVKVVADNGPRLTSTGELLGNLQCASPELLRGSPVLDARSDLYSVGCLLHLMLTGRPPFDASTPPALVAGHLGAPPPLLADCGVEVPAGLQELATALLAKEREARPGSAAETYAALGPYLPAAQPGPDALRRFGPEDPRRPFVLPQGPYPV